MEEEHVLFLLRPHCVCVNHFTFVGIPSFFKCYQPIKWLSVVIMLIIMPAQGQTAPTSGPESAYHQYVLYSN